MGARDSFWIVVALFVALGLAGAGLLAPLASGHWFVIPALTLCLFAASAACAGRRLPPHPLLALDMTFAVLLLVGFTAVVLSIQESAGSAIRARGCNASEVAGTGLSVWGIGSLVTRGVLVLFPRARSLLLALCLVAIPGVVLGASLWGSGGLGLLHGSTVPAAVALGLGGLAVSLERARRETPAKLPRLVRRAAGLCVLGILVASCERAALAPRQFRAGTGLDAPTTTPPPKPTGR